MPFIRFSSIVLLVKMICIFSAISENRSRELHPTFNENCTVSFCKNSKDESYVNVFHVKAVGRKDVLHYIWSTYGSLTGIIARTSLDASLHIDWTKMQNNEYGAITIEPPDDVFFSSAIIFNQLYQYADVNDTANVTKGVNISSSPFSSFKWGDARSSFSLQNSSITFNSTTLGKNSSTGILFTMQAFPSSSRASDLPRLLHSENCSYFELTLNGLNIKTENARFAAEVILIRGDEKGGNISQEKVLSLDDEYTPAVFEIFNLLFSQNATGDTDASEDKGGFVSWKPVTYTLEDRHSSNGVLVKEYGLNRTFNNFPAYSIAHAYFGNLTRYESAALNISFGIDSDGFYSKTNYSVWGGLLGYGDPPKDSFSTLVIIIISAGFGIPVALIIFGGSFTFIHRQVKKRKMNRLLVHSFIQ